MAVGEIRVATAGDESGNANWRIASYNDSHTVWFKTLVHISRTCAGTNLHDTLLFPVLDGLHTSFGRSAMECGHNLDEAHVPKSIPIPSSTLFEKP
jgi:hypothetical protein